MRLYSYWRSSSSWRVRIALAFKGIAYEYAPVHLLPQDPYLRARSRQLAEIVNSGIQALQAAAQETAGTHLVGDEVSFADLCLVPQLYNARRFGVDLGEYPTLLRVEAACGALPAFAAAHPDRQPDAVPT
jgi:maleylpyruvate isomerase